MICVPLSKQEKPSLNVIEHVNLQTIDVTTNSTSRYDEYLELVNIQNSLGAFLGLYFVFYVQ